MKKLMSNEQGFIPMIIALFLVLIAIIIFAYLHVQKVNK